ncbi:hypothetical protein [Thiomicrorhabdus cannonii]|uniref:hypothetical protein n=1 Tax=Thiomicrorhabdus cannonii TaxID=2748011 RepID=UPI0015B982B1|nr:hypothetical protein [Thiomicrorhabdus cannonii]
MWDALLDILLYVPRQIFSAFVDGLIYLLNLIPAPEFFSSVDLSGLNAIGWWLTVFQVPAGMAMVMGALIARFILRRIPLIG